MQMNHKTKGINLLIILFFLAPIIAFGQDDKERINEIGVYAYGSNYGLEYKKPLKNGKYLVLNGSLKAGLESGENQYSSFTLSSSFAVHMEKRVPLREKMYFAHGLGVGINSVYLLRNNPVTGFTDRRDSIFSLGINPFYKLGFQYHFSEKLYIEASINPSLRLSYQHRSTINQADVVTDNRISGNVHLSTQSAKIGLFYRF